jgi:uncharacterized BrkB/YihY/UPF0761 family membrane protein
VSDLYGAFGLAIVILLWLYIVSRVFVGGMFLNATIAGVPAGHLEEEGMIPETPPDDASSEVGAPPG